MAGWETMKNLSMHTEEFIKNAIINKKIQGSPLVLHSDNGSPKKAATFRTLLETWVQISYFRPRVRIDNPYSEAIFRTMKYQHEFPNNSFKNLPVTRECSSLLVYWYNYEHQHN